MNKPIFKDVPNTDKALSQLALDHPINRGKWMGLASREGRQALDGMEASSDTVNSRASEPTVILPKVSSL